MAVGSRVLAVHGKLRAWHEAEVIRSSSNGVTVVRFVRDHTTSTYFALGIARYPPIQVEKGYGH